MFGRPFVGFKDFSKEKLLQSFNENELIQHWKTIVTEIFPKIEVIQEIDLKALASNDEVCLACEG
jgi:hypothetical protein